MPNVLMWHGCTSGHPHTGLRYVKCGLRVVAFINVCTTMGLINHIFNFLLPALWLATLLTGIDRLLFRSNKRRGSWLQQWLLLFVATATVFLGGLLFFGRDGKMATYVAAVVVAGLVQALLPRKALPNDSKT